LIGEGVQDYSYEDLVDDVTTAKAVLAHRMVAGDDLLDTGMEDGEPDLVDVIVQRVVGWVDFEE
jgi:hypothetical protein